MDIQIIAMLLLAGAAAGFTAGLLGVGGGLIVVPLSLWALKLQGFQGTDAQQIAIGTSFGVMVFTTLMSMLAQHKRRAIDWTVVRAMLLGTAIGTLFGALVAGAIPSRYLQIFFVIFAYTVAVRSFSNAKSNTAKPNSTKPNTARTLPPPSGLAAVSSGIGLISSLLGIGGGVLNVPFLSFCSVPMKNAVGISAAMTFFIAVFGAAGYVYSGWYTTHLPPYSLGYCNVPMIAGFAVTSMIFAPFGVKISHQLSEAMLKRCFALLAVTVATQMLWEVLFG